VSDKAKFDFSDRLGAQQAAQTLESLAQALREGHVTLRGAGQSISLEPTGLVKLKVEADGTASKGHIGFSLSWKPSYSVMADRLVAIPDPGTDRAPAEPAVAGAAVAPDKGELTEGALTPMASSNDDEVTSPENTAAAEPAAVTETETEAMGRPVRRHSRGTGTRKSSRRRDME